MVDPYYGRGSTLKKLDAVMNDDYKHPFTRMQAEKAFYKILRQLKDPKLILLRRKLEQAAQAEDEAMVNLYSFKIREYEQQDRETGL